MQLSPANLEYQGDLFEYYLQAPGFLGGGLDKAQTVAEHMTSISPPDGQWAEAKLAEMEAKLTPPAEYSAPPVGAAEGCDLLIFSLSITSATSYNLHHRRPIAPKSPGF